MAKSRGLGRGLDSLIPAPARQEAGRQDAAGNQGPPREIEAAKIVPSRWQPRREFDPEKLEELARSIEASGLIQPVSVRALPDGRYEVVVGERRLRAMRDILKRERIPVAVMEVDDAKMRELALVENLQRDDLNPIEEALAYHELRQELGVTHEAIAEMLKVSRPKITNALRLLELPEEIKVMIAEGVLAAGTARALLSLSNPVAQIKLARRAVEEHLSTRRVEQLAAEKPRDKGKPEERKRPVHVLDLEERLRRHFGSKVKVEDEKGKGRIIVEYYSVDEAQRILDRMGLAPE